MKTKWWTVINRRTDAKKRSEFTEVMFDENFKYVPKSKWHKVKGFYVRVHIHADKSENQKEYNNSGNWLFLMMAILQKLRSRWSTTPGPNPVDLGPDRLGSQKSSDIFKTLKKRWVMWNRLHWWNPDGFKKPKKISDLWKIYREQDLEMRSISRPSTRN